VLVAQQAIGLREAGGSRHDRVTSERQCWRVLRRGRRGRVRPASRPFQPADKDTLPAALLSQTRLCGCGAGEVRSARDSARNVYWALARGRAQPAQGASSTFLAKETRGRVDHGPHRQPYDEGATTR